MSRFEGCHTKETLTLTSGGARRPNARILHRRGGLVWRFIALSPLSVIVTDPLSPELPREVRC